MPAHPRCIVGDALRLAPRAPAVPRGAFWASPSPAGPKGAGRRTGRDVTRPQPFKPLPGGASFICRKDRRFPTV